jgi:hypothetical protein
VTRFRYLFDPYEFRSTRARWNTFAASWARLDDKETMVWADIAGAYCLDAPEYLPAGNGDYYISRG